MFLETIQHKNRGSFWAWAWTMREEYSDTSSHWLSPNPEWSLIKKVPGASWHLTFNVRGQSYLGLTRSISWLLMPWLLTSSPSHQQPWYWLYRICRSFSYLREDFKYLCHINVDKWHKCKYMFMFPLKNLARKGLSVSKHMVLICPGSGLSPIWHQATTWPKVVLSIMYSETHLYMFCLNSTILIPKK